jgi:16S rRNA (uracil1498-N3)-methyltransferase
MHVFYHPGKGNVLSDKESHHAVNVLRLKAGDRIMVLDGNGKVTHAILTEMKAKGCSFETEHEEVIPSRPFRLHIAFGILKQSDRMEWMIEKATEIGVDELTPVICDHAERKKVNIERFEKTAIAAIKQSRQPYLPFINPAQKLDEFIGSHIPGYIAHCNDGIRKPLKEFDQSLNAVTILIGPEGDFSPDEVEAALSAGWQPVSLGDSRLRAETAAIVACHSIHLLKD